MKILITNDDGIASSSLPRLADWAEQFGEVTVIAPCVEQSGRSHAIDFHAPIEIKRVTLEGGREAWSVASTPADCVRFGFLGLKEHYDLVLSGVNRGYNLGADIVYSGTIGAIFEAARMGTRAIAFSCDVDGFDGAFAELAGAGATTPLSGFGYLIAKGVREAVNEKGFLGVFTGPLTAAAGGTAAALVFGLLAAFVCRGGKPRG